MQKLTHRIAGRCTKEEFERIKYALRLVGARGDTKSEGRRIVEVMLAWADEIISNCSS